MLRDWMRTDSTVARLTIEPSIDSSSFSTFSRRFFVVVVVVVVVLVVVVVVVVELVVLGVCF